MYRVPIYSFRNKSSLVAFYRFYTFSAQTTRFSQLQFWLLRITYSLAIFRSVFDRETNCNDKFYFFFFFFWWTLVASVGVLDFPYVIFCVPTPWRTILTHRCNAANEKVFSICCSLIFLAAQEAFLLALYKRIMFIFTSTWK